MPSQRSERVVEDSPAAETHDQAVFDQAAASPEPGAAGGRAPEADGAGAMSLHVSKLRGISLDVRIKLKRQGVSYTHQLLREAGSAEQCRRLAARSRIDEATLQQLVRRADLARIKGIGAIFADMLEMIGIHQVTSLAEQDPSALHARPTATVGSKGSASSLARSRRSTWISTAGRRPPATRGAVRSR